MKKILPIIIVIASVNMLFAQEHDRRVLPAFSKVSVGEAISLTLVPGDKNEAKVSVKGNISLPDVETSVHGSWLRIRITGSHRGNTEVAIVLTYKSLAELNISSAASVKTKGPVKATDLTIEVSSAADADLEILTKELTVEVSSAANLTLAGSTVTQEVSVSSAAEYDGADLACEMADVTVSSAGSARIAASRELKAEANSGGTIKYSGTPQKVYVNTSSGGDIDKVH